MGVIFCEVGSVMIFLLLIEGEVLVRNDKENLLIVVMLKAY